MPVRKKRRGQPHKVLHLTTYDRLEQYLMAFAQGHFHLLILVGAGGLAKSRSVRSVLDGKAERSTGTHPLDVHAGRCPTETAETLPINRRLTGY